MCLIGISPIREPINFEKLKQAQGVLNILLATINEIGIKEICALRRLDRTWKRAVHSNATCLSVFTLIFARRCNLSILHIGPKDRHNQTLPTYLDPSFQKTTVYLNASISIFSTPKLDADCNLLGVLQNLTAAILKHGNLDNLLVMNIVFNLRRSYPQQYNPDTEIANMYAQLQMSEEALQNKYRLSRCELINTYCCIVESNVTTCNAKKVAVDVPAMKKFIDTAKEESKHHSSDKEHTSDYRNCVIRMARALTSIGLLEEAISTLSELNSSEFSDDGVVQTIVEAFVTNGRTAELENLNFPGIHESKILESSIKALIEAGNLELALQKLKSMQVYERNNSWLTPLLAEAFIRQGNFEALKDIDIDSIKNCNRFRIYLAWGKKLISLGRKEEAFSMFEKAKKENTSDNFSELAYMEAEKGQFNEILVLLCRASKKYSNHDFLKTLEMLVQYAKDLNKPELLKGVIEAMSGFKGQDRIDPMIILGKTQAHFKDPAYKQTLNEILKLIQEVNNNVSKEYVKLTRVYQELGDLDSARSTLKDALNKIKNENGEFLKGEYNVEMLIEYALVLAELGDTKTGLDAISKAETMIESHHRSNEIKEKIYSCTAKLMMYSGNIKGAIEFIVAKYPKHEGHHDFYKINIFKELVELFYKNQGTFVALN